MSCSACRLDSSLFARTTKVMVAVLEKQKPPIVELWRLTQRERDNCSFDSIWTGSDFLRRTMLTMRWILVHLSRLSGGWFFRETLTKGQKERRLGINMSQLSLIKTDVNPIMNINQQICTCVLTFTKRKPKWKWVEWWWWLSPVWSALVSA